MEKEEEFIPLPLHCPECTVVFEPLDYENFRRHILRHEPYYIAEELLMPKKCKKKCGRWIDIRDQQGHERLCYGDEPFTNMTVIAQKPLEYLD